jgi:hypothetical protein
MAVKSLHQFFYYHSKYLNIMKCQEISMGPSIGEIQCRHLHFFQMMNPGAQRSSDGVLFIPHIAFGKV